MVEREKKKKEKEKSRQQNSLRFISGADEHQCDQAADLILNIHVISYLMTSPSPLCFYSRLFLINPALFSLNSSFSSTVIESSASNTGIIRLVYPSGPNPTLRCPELLRGHFNESASAHIQSLLYCAVQ